MNHPRVPSALVGGVAALPDLFVALGRSRGIPREEVRTIADLVPAEINATPCFLDRLTGIWRYDFGEPFVNLPGGGVVLGTNMYQEVERLYAVLSCAQRRLSKDRLSSYLATLGNPAKHEDALVEFAPILRLGDEVETEYEVAGHGDGNRTVDWVIRASGHPLVLLDVKNRVKDLLESLVRLQAGERSPDDSGPAPIHDPSLLFGSVEPKFKSQPPSEAIQAVWVHTCLKQEEAELDAAFRKLDPRRVHAAILGDWAADVYILAKDPTVKAHLAEVLRVDESHRFVFRRVEG
jgi:hypothetical protein